MCCNFTIGHRFRKPPVNLDGGGAVVALLVKTREELHRF